METITSGQNVNLSPSDIGEFKRIYLSEYGEELPDAQAHQIATDLLNLYTLLCSRPIPIPQDCGYVPLQQGKRYDTLGTQMDKTPFTTKESQALRYLRNAIVHEGQSPSVRDLARELGYKSPRTAFLLLQKFITMGYVQRKPDGKLQMRKREALAEDRASTVPIPLVGTVACGTPMLAEENIEAYVPVSNRLAKPGARYFLLRASGDSMDKAGIEDGDLLLVRQQATAENGQTVVALIDDSATVKEFHQEKGVIVLKPRSRNREHRPMILTEEFQIQGIVACTIPAVEL